jgi:ATP-dependent helicase HepA
MGWEVGMKVVHRAQRAWGVGVIVQIADEGRRLAVRFAGREGITVVSGRDQALTEVPKDTPIEQTPGGPIDQIAGAQQGPASAFALRARVLRLESLRRADSLGALLSSRIHVLPHQIGAAGRILSDRMPRFVLADEVGLGKTVEAGLVFAGMRQLGIAERVLVVVPEHLAFQWLAELFHKFNALFTLLTPERVAELGGVDEALARSTHAIVSFEHLRADPELAAAASDVELDLVVVDEAHHLADDALHDLVAPICRSSFGVLLLTATPVRLDPREYFRLLALVEPVPSTSLDEFLRRLEDHESYATVARALLAGGSTADALTKLRELAPDDPVFADEAEDGDEAEEADEAEAGGEADTRLALLAHLAERYSLSARLIRNRRVKVGAFTARVLRRVDVPDGGKRAALAELCVRLARSGDKVLAFGSDLDALRALQGAIATAGLEALLYEDATTLEGRDRLVARFRDQEGPMILLSGESGGEGRNFQFAHHLVCADLPESPLVLEQRIGRLDRLGQTHPVEIHVPVEPGEETFLADLYEREIGIFDEPVGGLDAVLASLPEELEALRRKRTARARDTFRKDLAARVADARRAQHEGDPLLDIRSASLPELAALVRRAFARLGEDPPAELRTADGIGESLVTLSRWLEEELEECCTEVGRRVGMDVDTDQNVHPFEVAFTLGAGMKIEALPGMEIPEEPITVLGSFWRETAVAHDELQWFATGNRLIEALVGLVRDGDAGRSAALKRDWAPRRGALYARFEPRLATSADVAPGARVASRQAERYLDLAPIAVMVDLETGHRVLPGAAQRLEEEAEAVGDARMGPAPHALLEAALAAARKEAEAVLARRKAEALEALDAHFEGEEMRLVEAGFGGGAARGAIEAALYALRHHREVTGKALDRLKLGLDAAAVLVP